jgi:hypothetical protein
MFIDIGWKECICYISVPYTSNGCFVNCVFLFHWNVNVNILNLFFWKGRKLMENFMTLVRSLSI